MIIRLHAAGKSFKSLAAYLLHDPDKALTGERVAWTHTLNLANDDPGLGVHEMLWTYRAADALKREAGIRAGGRRLEKPVVHLSLSWEPSDHPIREHMIEAVESFLTHMGWRDKHQALLIAHDDTAHRHVHVMLNGIAFDTGLKLDTSHDWHRAEAWGLQYEIDRGKIHCLQRLQPRHERTPTPTRETWQQLRAFEREDDAHEAGGAAGSWDYLDWKTPEERRDREWQMLKEHQHEQRDAFFAEGKQVYREVRHAAYREVRAAFCGEWRDYYAAERDGQDRESLTARKQDIVARQQAELSNLRGAVTTALRAERDQYYIRLLAHHRQQRRELREGQALGRTHTALDLLQTSKDWEARQAQQSHERVQPASDNYFERRNARVREQKERELLRGHQRERLFESGKDAFRQVRRGAKREVDAGMRPTWQSLRQARTAGHNRLQLAAMRATRGREHKETQDLRGRIAVLVQKSREQMERSTSRAQDGAEREALRHRQRHGVPSYRLMQGDAPRVSAADVAARMVKDEQARREAREQTWRRAVPVVPSPVRLQDERATRQATERSDKIAEHEDRVRQAWRRARPGPSRGRD